MTTNFKVTWQRDLKITNNSPATDAELEAAMRDINDIARWKHNTAIRVHLRAEVALVLCDKIKEAGNPYCAVEPEDVSGKFDFNNGYYTRVLIVSDNEDKFNDALDY